MLVSNAPALGGGAAIIVQSICAYGMLREIEDQPIKMTWKMAATELLGHYEECIRRHATVYHVQTRCVFMTMGMIMMRTRNGTADDGVDATCTGYACL